MTERLFMDGTGITPGTEGCKCGPIPEWMRSRIEPQPDGCWWWRGRAGGQGRPRVLHEGRITHVYKLILEAVTGEQVQRGAHIHHRCEQPRCVNPNHLVALSVSDHWRAHKRVPPDRQSKKTHCPRGHAYDEANTYRHGGKRFCRTCQRDSTNAKNAALRTVRALTCPECGTEFTTTDDRKVYCKRACKNRAWHTRKAMAHA